MALTRVKKVPTANLVQGSDFLTTSSNIAAARLPAGTVIQTVYVAYSSQVSSNNNTYTTTGLTGSITPTSSSNKILVQVQQNGVYKDGSNTEGVNIRLLRGSTQIANPAKRAGGDNGDGTAATMSIGTVGIDVLDAPNTTSAVTYSTEFRAEGNAGNAYVQVYTVESTLVLQEIAA